MNRRGYEGSSPPHKSKVQTPLNQEAFGRTFVDYLAFIKYAVDNLGIPPKNIESQSGGLVLFGWSKGNTAPMCLLSLLPTLPDETKAPWLLPISLRPYQSMIDTHVRSVILYEPPQDLVDLPPSLVYPHLGPLTPETFADGYSSFLRSTILADRAHLADVANDTTHIWEDATMWHEDERSERAEVAHNAFDEIPPHLGVGVMWWTGM